MTLSLIFGAMVDSNALPSIPPAFSVLPRFIINLSVLPSEASREAARASVYDDSSLETTLETLFIVCISFVKKDEAKGLFCASVTESGVDKTIFVVLRTSAATVGASTLKKFVFVIVSA